MIKHLFKLIWNQKRKNALLILEIFVSFLVLFAVLSLLLYQYKNYKEPFGFDYEDVWVINFELHVAQDSSTIGYHHSLKDQLQAFSEIEQLSFSNSNVPFSMSTNTTVFSNEGVEVNSSVFEVDENYKEVLGIELTEGRWFTEADNAGKNLPIVISRELKMELFGEVNALGKTVQRGERNFTVVGIVDHFKYRDFEDVRNTAFLPFRPENVFQSVALLKMKPGVEADFEAHLSKTVSSIIKGRQSEIEQMTDKKDAQFQVVLIPLIILLIVCSFLIFNVILGLFGILWYNINKRKNEIGLRRALGASQNSITSQFIGEIIFISTLGIVLGTFFAVQFPILQVFGLASGIYMSAILLAGLLIYLIVIVCAFYPSQQASKIHPALALHQD